MQNKVCKPHFFSCKKIVFLKNTYYNDFKVGDNVSKIIHKKKKHIKNAFYLSHFIAKAFLLAVFGIISLICLIVVVYFGDVFINLQRGVYKYPLFGAYVIVSPSMVPTINVKDAVVVKRSDEDELKIGDIITFSSTDARYTGLTITHRIVDKKNSNGNMLFRTKGDNNTLEDKASVATDNIYGKVILKMPMVGYLQEFFSKPINFIIVFVGIISIVLVYDGLRIVYLINRKA